MPIRLFTAENFRCLQRIELEADPHYNLIFGRNASGKTSILEAIAYLGRGKSFRGAATTDLVRHGEREFVLYGEVSSGTRTGRMGVRNSHAGLDIRVDGNEQGGAAALATALPLQIIDPDVHELVAGAPDQRRRYLDWIAFHVEPGYGALWRRFRRALKQRNAALRAGTSGPALAGWNTEFSELAALVDGGRRRALSAALAALRATGLELLGSEVDFEYRPGWNEERGLLQALEDGVERDLQYGSTQCGPHRADLRLDCDARRARKLVSRGQQKLLACAMVLAAVETTQSVSGQPLLLLLDDPGAELDRESLRRLMGRVAVLGSQVVATSLEADTPLFPAAASVFHVELGELKSAS